MKISIALAVYNGTNYLCEQLESYLKQTRLPDELVVVDDCSTDHTVIMLEEFAASAPFSVLILKNEKNSGSTVGFDRAISNCTGDIIFLSDHDDVWFPEKIERMSQEFSKSPELGLLQANAEVVDQQLKPMGWMVFEKSFPEEKRKQARERGLFQVLLDRNVVGGATSAFRTEYRNFFSPMPDRIGRLHDGWIGLIISAMAKTDFLTEPLMQYRQHAGQQVGTAEGEAAMVFDRKKMALDAQQDYEAKISNLKFIIETLTGVFERQSQNTFLPKAISTARAELTKAEQALDHFRVRGELSSTRPLRVPAVLAECLTGRYHKFSKGLKSVARDLISP